MSPSAGAFPAPTSRHSLGLVDDADAGHGNCAGSADAQAAVSSHKVALKASIIAGQEQADFYAQVSKHSLS